MPEMIFLNGVKSYLNFVCKAMVRQQETKWVRAEIGSKGEIGQNFKKVGYIPIFNNFFNELVCCVRPFFIFVRCKFIFIFCQKKKQKEPKHNAMVIQSLFHVKVVTKVTREKQKIAQQN